MTQREADAVASIRAELDRFGITVAHLSNEALRESVVRFQQAIAGGGITFVDAARAIDAFTKASPRQPG